MIKSKGWVVVGLSDCGGRIEELFSGVCTASAGKNIVAGPGGVGSDVDRRGGVDCRALATASAGDLQHRSVKAQRVSPTQRIGGRIWSQRTPGRLEALRARVS